MMSEETDYAKERQYMVERQLKSRDIRDRRVLSAMRSIPRHRFVPSEYRHLAYTDGPLPIGSGQTISQPYIVALMTQMLRLKGHETVLEIGTGSGYQAAILAILAKDIHTIERHADLAEHASQVLTSLELTNVQVHTRDGSLGLPEFAPYQAILVTAAAPQIPQTLLSQLDDGGRLVIPVGGRLGQNLERWERHGFEYTSEYQIPVAFVPLRGRYGWQEGEWETY
jgi:protein-L-isoaspartate(D-aspartate) O-methyltransferase